MLNGVVCVSWAGITIDNTILSPPSSTLTRSFLQFFTFFSSHLLFPALLYYPSYPLPPNRLAEWDLWSFIQTAVLQVHKRVRTTGSYRVLFGALGSPYHKTLPEFWPVENTGRQYSQVSSPPIICLELHGPQVEDLCPGRQPGPIGVFICVLFLNLMSIRFGL